MSTRHPRPSAAAEEGEPFSAMALPRFLDALAAPTPAPGGGSAAALCVAVAAALATMAARLSQGHTGRAGEVAAECVSLLARATALCDQDASSFSAVMAARRDGRRDDDALSAAAEVPLAVAECGARVAGLAAGLGEDGNPALRGDACTAALLAAAGAESAAILVRINLAAHPDDGRVARAGACARHARGVAAGLV